MIDIKYITYLNESSCIDPVFSRLNEPLDRYDLIGMPQALPIDFVILQKNVPTVLLFHS